MDDHGYELTDVGDAVLRALDALAEIEAHDTAIDLYPTDVHDDVDAHGS